MIRRPPAALTFGAGPLGRFGPPLVIAAAAILAYLPSLHGAFVFDDVPAVQQSAAVHGPLWRIWFGGAAPDYWPLTWTSFWIEWRVWGERTWGYHAANLALHVATAILLWRALRALRLPGAWLAGLLFAIHPVTVESVAWIVERKNVLSAVLFLGTIIAWTRYDEAGRRRDLALAILAFAAALLAKTSVVPLPFVLLGISVWRMGRLDGRTARASVPFFALALAAGLTTAWFQRRNAMDHLWLPPRGIAERVGGAAWALGSYLEAAFVPARLAFIHLPWPLDASSPWYYVPLALLLVAGAVLWRFRAGHGGPILLALGYHALMVLPVLGLVDIAYFKIGPVSNHLQYLALMGPIALVAAAVARAAGRWPRATAAGASALAVLLLATTARRAAAFEDELTLWRAAVRDAPESTVARHELAICLVERGRTAEALEELRTMADVARDPAERHHARSLWLLASGRTGEAAVEAERALALRPDPELRRDLGVALSMAGRSGEAVAVLEPLVRLAPNDVDYRYWLAAALSRAGRLEQAAEVLREGLRLTPGEGRLLEALAVVDRRRGAPSRGRDEPSRSDP